MKIDAQVAIKNDLSRPVNKQVGEGVIKASLNQLDIVPNKYLMVWGRDDARVDSFEDSIQVPVLETIQTEESKHKTIETFNSILYDCMDQGYFRFSLSIVNSGFALA